VTREGKKGKEREKKKKKKGNVTPFTLPSLIPLVSDRIGAPPRRKEGGGGEGGKKKEDRPTSSALKLSFSLTLQKNVLGGREGGKKGSSAGVGPPSAACIPF